MGTQKQGPQLATNITSVYLGGQAHKWPPPTGNLQTKFYTPGTYNLNGGLLQTSFIAEDGHLTAAQSALVNFNFSGGTLQADPTAGCYVAIPVTIGTAASSVATFDANGKSVDLNHNGACLFRPGPVKNHDERCGRLGYPRR